MHVVMMAALLFAMPLAVARVLWHHFKELATHIPFGIHLAEVRSGPSDVGSSGCRGIHLADDIVSRILLGADSARASPV